jgi:hypothetical protein
MRPNIFEIATKELNQDAFITWLLQFADDKYETTDKVLNECGKSFVHQLIRKQLPNFAEQIVKVNAGRQWENIDVWAEINDKYLVIIEDKTYTSSHSNQLTRYKNIAEEWCLKNNYEKPICIYLKTGNESQSSLNGIIKEGFAVFNRIDFINLLQQYTATQNNIFIDFLERLTRIEKSNNEFEDKNIGDWSDSDWQGFFQYLEREISIINWNYVNNPNGGFWNAILNWEYWDIYPVYIQIEQGKLCFKISTDPDEVEMPENMLRGDVRNKLHNLILSKAKELSLPNIRRPDRFGNGKSMTVAIVDKENWLGADNSKIKKETVINLLTTYTDFLKLNLTDIADREENAL